MSWDKSFQFTDGIASAPNGDVFLTDVMIAGTYRSVTVDANGRVISGSNPTTLAGYFISDAYTKSEVQTSLPVIGFVTANATAPGFGQVAWNTEDRTLEVGLDSGVVLQLGQETLVLVRNGTGSTIPNGTVVMYTGTLGSSGRMVVTPMDASNVNNTRRCVGLATEDIPAGADGFATNHGKVRGLNTSAFNEGDLLYASTTVPGGLTNIKPAAGSMAQPICLVVTKHATVGTVMVRVVPINYNQWENADPNIQAHIAATGNTHGAIASQIPFTATGDIVATNVQTAVAEVASDATNKANTAEANAKAYTYSQSQIDTKDSANATALTNHLNDTVDAHMASAIGNTPAGNIAATTVQAAINELDTEKAPVGQTMYIGTTAVTINRASSALVLTGITSIDGNAATSTKLATARTLSLSGDVSGSVSFDGSGNADIIATVADNSHNHTTLTGAVTATSFNSITALSSTTPSMDGIGAVGVSTTAARADHVHPTDTSRAASSHTHAAADINSGVLSTARLGTGTPSVSTYLRGDGAWVTLATGTGDVIGPIGATDNAIARYDTTTGKLIQGSGVTIDDAKNIAGVATITATTFSGALSGNATSATNADKLDGKHASAFAPSGYGLGSQATFITGDLNVDRPTGFYRGENLTNAPEAGWWYIIHTTNNNSALSTGDFWCSQIAIALGEDNPVSGGVMHGRVHIGSETDDYWTEWKRLTTSDEVLLLSGGTMAGGIALPNNVGLDGQSTSGSVLNLVKRMTDNVTAVGSTTVGLSLYANSQPSWYNGTATKTLATTDQLASVPSGAVSHFAMSSPPSGWLKANGAAVSRATYSGLFSAIGTTFGVGDGSTTFNLPDLRGVFVRGWDDGRGYDSGRVFGSYQADDNKAHTHSGGAKTGATTFNGGESSSVVGALTGSSGGAEARPKNVALLACIKY